MHIIIPMSGIGKRFVEAGYKAPKPLIVVEGKPIIAHVVDMFPGETKFSFICNSEHLTNTNMGEVLKSIAPSGEIIEITPHKKGPVYAVSQIFEKIDDEEEVIVNYCDFGKFWDYKAFLKETRERSADGAVSAYKGFHPHMLGSTNYAFMRECGDRWMLEIKEKEPFTNNRMQEWASDGTYYFKKGKYIKKYFQELMQKDINLNGEFYVSLVYNLLVQDGLKVSIFPIENMLQWGTPQDLEEYIEWSEYFKKAIQPKKNITPKPNSTTIIPLAGRGQRFVNEGYNDPKPLIKVNDKPMIINAASSLPLSNNFVFVCLSEHLKNYPLEEEIKKAYRDATIIGIDGVTEGQACSVEIGVADINKDSSLLIGACDNGMIWDVEKYQELLKEDTDVVVFTFRNHPSSERNPQMYGWVKVDENDSAIEVSVKKPISTNPKKDHAVVGTFYFKNKKVFEDSLQKLYEKNIRVNGEFYVDSLINEAILLGYRAKVFEVEHYICWGTPNDLRTFEYWQEFFDKVSWHPYKKLPLRAFVHKNLLLSRIAGSFRGLQRTLASLPLIRALLVLVGTISKKENI